MRQQLPPDREPGAGRAAEVKRRAFLRLLGMAGVSACALVSACAAPAAPTQPAAPAKEPAAAPAAKEPAAPAAKEAAPVAPAKPAAPAPAAAPAKGKELTTIRVSLNNPILIVGVNFFWIGEQLGYYAQEGLKVEMQGANGAAEATNLLATGKTDFGPPPPSAVLESAANGRDLGLMFVYAYVRSPIYWYAVKADSPIKDLPDLVGKKIGVLNLGDEGITFTKATMRELGRDPDKDVQIMATGATVQSGRALDTGQVDAICLGDAQYGPIEAAGIKMRYLPYPKFYSKIFSNYIAARKETVEKRPEVITGYLRGLSKGLTFFTANPEASVRLHWKMIPESKPTGVSEDEALKQALVGINYRIPRLLGFGKENMPRGEETPENWENFLDYVGLKGKIADPSKFYTNQFVKEANNFDQAAIVAQAKAWKE